MKVASESWVLDLMKKALAEFTPASDVDATYGVGTIDSEPETYGDSNVITLGDGQYGYIKTDETITEVLINKIPTTVVDLENGVYRTTRSALGTIKIEFM